MLHVKALFRPPSNEAGIQILVAVSSYTIKSRTSFTLIGGAVANT